MFTMSVQNQNKINQLLSQWQDGVIMTSRWLSQCGYSPQLLKKYETAGWVRKIGQGAYAKLKDEPSWPGGLVALQQQLNLPLHVGGLSALELHGLAQYIAFEETHQMKIFLYNTTEKRNNLPKWFADYFNNCIYYQAYLFENEIGLEEKSLQGIKLFVSSAERAIIELLALVPNIISYQHVYEISENLQLLRPDLMQKLLEQCKSIKAKRLFLYLADKHQLPCFSYLNVSRIDLGTGKRMISPGGHYVAKYQLAVPKNENDFGEDDV
jgi:hypothetical protein